MGLDNIFHNCQILLRRYMVICRKMYFQRRTIVGILIMAYGLPIIIVTIAPLLTDFSSFFTYPVPSDRVEQ